MLEKRNIFENFIKKKDHPRFRSFEMDGIIDENPDQVILHAKEIAKHCRTERRRTRQANFADRRQNKISAVF